MPFVPTVSKPSSGVTETVDDEDEEDEAADLAVVVATEEEAEEEEEEDEEEEAADSVAAAPEALVLLDFFPELEGAEAPALEEVIERVSVCP